MNNKGIKVYSEIGALKKVMLHRPGEEIENLIPEYLERLLFDDIPYLKVAREEHDEFSKLLSFNGVEVLYLEKLVAESIENEEIKDVFLNEVIRESGIRDMRDMNTLKKYFLNMPTKAMVDKVMAGVRKNEIGIREEYEDYPFIMDPMPNLYFTRDPFACIGNGISLNNMNTVTRKRETIFGKYIFKYHHQYGRMNIPKWYERDYQYTIEGGDILVLSDEIVAVGYSERTESNGIYKFAENILNSNQTFKTILMFDIPKSRAFMHLDTVFTMIDKHVFTVHPGIEGALKVTAITYNQSSKTLNFKEEIGSLEVILSKHLNIDVKLIRCGDGDKIASGREQWNDGSNTLAIAPGRVITYERNYVTNELLDKNNITVLPIKASELSRGRGGPRCMSMPFYREKINEEDY